MDIKQLYVFMDGAVRRARLYNHFMIRVRRAQKNGHSDSGFCNANYEEARLARNSEMRIAREYANQLQ